MHRRWARQLVAFLAVAMLLLAGIADAQAASMPRAVTGWVRHNATVLDTVDPAAPLDDLAPLPPPAPDWLERSFGQTGLSQFAVDLRTPAPPPVRSWLRSPVKTRGLLDRGSGSYMAGGTLAQWFDVIIHRQELTPAQPT